MSPIWNMLSPLIQPVLDKVLGYIPEPNKRAEAKEEMERTLLTGLMAVNAAQAEVNKQEAAHKSVFVAGWRPYIGWVSGAAITYSFIVCPLLKYVLLLIDPSIPPPPDLDTAEIFGLTTSMLGIAGLRSWEKSRGVARSA